MLEDNFIKIPSPFKGDLGKQQLLHHGSRSGGMLLDVGQGINDAKCCSIMDPGAIPKGIRPGVGRWASLSFPDGTFALCALWRQVLVKA